MEFFLCDEQYNGCSLLVNDKSIKAIELYFTRDEAEELSNQLFHILGNQKIIEKIKDYAETCLEFYDGYFEILKDLYEDFLIFQGLEKSELSQHRFCRCFLRLYKSTRYKQIKFHGNICLALIGVRKYKEK